MILEYKLDFQAVKQAGIDPLTVISHDKDDLPLSRFEDDEWDFSYQQGHKLNFASWFDGEPDDLFYKIKLQLKTVFFVLMATPEARFRERYKSYPTYFTQLRKIARLAYRTGCSLATAHEHSFFQIAFRQSIAQSLDSSVNFYEGPLDVILKKLHYLNSREDTRAIIGVSLLDPEDYDEIMILINQIESSESKRTPLIPSRLYAKLIDLLSNEINYIEPHLENLKNFFIRYYTEPQYFAFTNDGYKTKKYHLRKKLESIGRKLPGDLPTLRDKKLQSKEAALKASKLSDLFGTHCRDVSYRALIHYLMGLQKTCALTCMIFSGMRAHELEVMPYNAIERAEIKGFGDVLALKTHTSKMNKGEYSKSMLWVTNELGEKAVRIAQVLAECFYMHRTGSIDLPDTSALPLWFSPSATKDPKLVHYDYPLLVIGNLRNSKLLSDLVITQEDIDELETFDALRDWDLSVGQVWPYSNHQCRRALVVYASRSGMVSLPSLGTQLKHLSLMMTALYAENSAFAENFVLDEKGNIPDEYSVVREFREQQIFNMSVAFHENVIAATTKLSGGKGTFIQLRKEKSDLPAVMKDRKSTEKAIKEGQLAYRETIVGGCMRKEVCDKYGVDDVVPCVFDCSDSIIGGDGGKKLKAYAEDLEWGLEDLDEASPAYKTTKRELERIKVKLLADEGIEL